MTGKELGARRVYPSRELDATGMCYAVHTGMTLRQHYAGLAMQGLLANPGYDFATDDGCAAMAVKRADALLERLARDD